MTKSLPLQWTPLLLSVSLPVDHQLIDDAEQELTTRAQSDANKCFGFFPGMRKDSISTDLPASRKLAEALPIISSNGKECIFNFLRLSLINQPSISPFHLDSDSATALTGSSESVKTNLVWRLLINLSSSKPRSVIYMNIDSESIMLSENDGYLSYDDVVEPSLIETVTLDPRKGSQVSAVLFCASKVLHAGKDVEGGHFVAGYGVDEQLT